MQIYVYSFKYYAIFLQTENSLFFFLAHLTLFLTEKTLYFHFSCI